MSLPSSMADFVPCNRLLQKAYCLDSAFGREGEWVFASTDLTLIAHELLIFVVHHADSQILKYGGS